MTTTTKTHEIKDLQQIALSEVSACDLREEIDGIVDDDSREAYRITLRRVGESEEAQEAQAAQMVWIPRIGRGGVSWGADATWSDADSPYDLARRVLVDDDLL